MFTGILRTNDGPHSAKNWAYATASMLALAFEVKPDSPNYVEIEMAKDKFRAEVTEIMIEHHDAVQRKERELLTSGHHDRLEMALDATEHTEIERAVADIKEAAQSLMALVTNAEVVPINPGTFDHISFEDQLDNVIRQRVSMDLTSSMQIERSWHADHHPDNPHSIAFRKATHPGPSA